MSYVDEVYERVVAQNPAQPEFHQAVKEVLESLRVVIEAHEEEYRKEALLERLTTPERQILANYYSEKFGDGFAFAYRFPGWEKVLQAVGRVIRTEEDTGFALLIDERLDSPEYISLFPDNWRL